MKVAIFLTSVILILGVNASNDAARDEEAVATAFLQCIKVSMQVGGVPDAHIPDHEPFAWTRNLTAEFDQPALSGWIKLENVWIDHIPDFDDRGITGAWVDTEHSRIAYDYDVYWDDMTLRGDYIADVTIALVHHQYQGTFNIAIQDWDWQGVWDMTVLEPRHLHNLTLVGSVGNVDTTLTGLGIINNNVVATLINTALKDGINSQPDILTKRLMPLLQQRFNMMWIDPYYAYRTDAILAKCHQKHPELAEIFPRTHYAKPKMPRRHPRSVAQTEDVININDLLTAFNWV